MTESEALIAALAKSCVEFVENPERLLRVTFRSKQTKTRLGIKFCERHRGPLLDKLIEAQTSLFRKAL